MYRRRQKFFGPPHPLLYLLGDGTGTGLWASLGGFCNTVILGGGTEVLIIGCGNTAIGGGIAWGGGGLEYELFKCGGLGTRMSNNEGIPPPPLEAGTADDIVIGVLFDKCARVCGCWVVVACVDGLGGCWNIGGGCRNDIWLNCCSNTTSCQVGSGKSGGWYGEAAPAPPPP